MIFTSSLKGPRRVNVRLEKVPVGARGRSRTWFFNHICFSEPTSELFHNNNSQLSHFAQCSALTCARVPSYRSINLFFICFHWIPGICLVTGVGLFLWPGCSVSAETLLLLLHRRRCYVLNSVFSKSQSKPSASKPGIVWALFQYFSISVSVLPGLPTKKLYEILHGWLRQNLACCSRNSTRQIIHSSFYLVTSTVFTACSLQLSAAQRQQACWTDWL